MKMSNAHHFNLYRSNNVNNLTTITLDYDAWHIYQDLILYTIVF